MAAERVKTATSFLDKKLDILERSWETLPSLDAIAAWDDDWRFDYLVEFQADQRYYHELIRDEAAGLLSAAQRERLRCIEQLMAERRPSIHQMIAPVEDDDSAV
jgi:hypothetical protein